MGKTLENSAYNLFYWSHGTMQGTWWLSLQILYVLQLPVHVVAKNIYDPYSLYNMFLYNEMKCYYNAIICAVTIVFWRV